MFTHADFIAFLKDKQQYELALLVDEFPEIVQPFLPKIQARLIEKGLLSAAASVADLTAAEQAAVPLLRELDDALRSGGSEAALEAFRAMAADPARRAILSAVVDGKAAA